MPTAYPAAIDTFDLGSPIPTDPKNDPSLSGEVTDLNDAVVAIESELGVVPSGTHATVADRIDDLDVRVQGIEGFVAGADVEYVNQAGDTMTGALHVPNLGFTTEGMTEAMDSDAWPEGLTIQQMMSGSWFTLGEVINLNESSVRRGQIALGKNGGMWIRGLNGNGPNFSAWQKIWTDANHGVGSGLDADLLDGQSSAYWRSRANHTGTQLHTTISDFDDGVRQNRLNQLAVPSGHASMNGYRLTNVGDPTSGTHAVNRNFLDSRFTAGHIIEDFPAGGDQNFGSERVEVYPTVSIPSHWGSWSLFATVNITFWTTESAIEGPTAQASFRISTPATNYPGFSSQLNYGVTSLARSSGGTKRYGHMTLSGEYSSSNPSFRLWLRGSYGDVSGLTNSNIGWDDRQVSLVLVRTS